MPATTEMEREAPVLKLESQVWKARAQAKQKWLERTLAESTDNARDGARRVALVKRTLDAVRRRKIDVSYRAALMDAYAEHLSVMEMILLAASEQQSEPAQEQAESTKGKKR